MEEELERIEGGETLVRLYCMRRKLITQRGSIKTPEWGVPGEPLRGPKGQKCLFRQGSQQQRNPGTEALPFLPECLCTIPRLAPVTCLPTVFPEHEHTVSLS